MEEDCVTQHTPMVTLLSWLPDGVAFTIFSALWSNEEQRVMCWQLDPTEGPCRERRRLMSVPRNIDDKYILDEGVKSDKQGNHGDASKLVIVT